MSFNQILNKSLCDTYELTRGKLARKEGGKILGSGSRMTIVVNLLVKNSKATEHDK